MANSVYTRFVPGVAFVAHCMLNQNSKTIGGARCPGIYSPLVDVLRNHGWRIEQMPCPELAFTGLNRFWAVREQYDTTAFRRHCRRIASAVVGAIEVHVKEGRDVVLVGLEGSPSMGVCITSSDPKRAGLPEWPAGSDELAPGEGIFIEELRGEMAARGIKEPRTIGITNALPDYNRRTEKGRLEAFFSK
jgi:predicted secreted protein